MAGLIMANCLAVSCAAAENQEMQNIALARNDRINELIDEVAAIKADLRDCDKSSEEYQLLQEEYHAKKEELSNLGADPDEDILKQAVVEAFRESDTYALDPDMEAYFADLVSTFQEAFDIWGISQVITASYGTYETYELVIQDTDGGNRLFRQIVGSNGENLIKVFPSSSINYGQSATDAVVDAVCSLLVEGMVLAVTGSALATSGVMLFAGVTVSYLTGIQDQINSGSISVSNNLENQYYVGCYANTTMRMVYVRESGTTQWYHCHTVNSAYIRTTHIYRYVTKGNNIETMPAKEYNGTVYAERFGFRHTDAITNYRSGAPMINENNVTYNVRNRVQGEITIDGVTYEIYDLEIATAMDLKELYY